MVDTPDKPSGDVSPDAGRHDEFLELCALSAAGSLNEEDEKKLKNHLARCDACRKALAEFGRVVDRDVPALAADLAPEETGEPPQDSSFSESDAEASFFKRLEDERKRSEFEAGDSEGWLSPLVVRRSRNFRRSLDRYHFWLPLAAAALLCLSLGILTYRMGRKNGFELARLEPAAIATPAAVPPQDVLLSAMEDHDAAKSRLAQQDKLITELQRAVAQQSAENAGLKALEKEQGLALRTDARDTEQSNREREALAQQAASAQSALEASEAKLRSLEAERSEESLRAAGLQRNVAELSRHVAQQDENIGQDQELLAKDRDIRELMGARDLYITEVHDISKTGETQKPFGRVFYTKGKSLIFYAYDLNDQPGLKDTSTFQAWGRRGPDWQQALNLGIFFEDNASKKRWVMKFNDKKALDQIDAVFVTVEPRAGSDRPTGRPFLFAYLKVAANHP
jgi:hypothetical protein